MFVCVKDKIIIIIPSVIVDYYIKLTHINKCGWITRDIRKLFEQEEDYYKPVRVDNFYSNNYVKYKSNSDTNKTLSLKEYLNKPLI